MKPLLLTGYTSHIAEIAEICLPSKREWANKHDCTLVVLREQFFPKDEGHPSFQKLRWIHHFLFGDNPANEPVIWLDADVMITNPRLAPEVLLPMSPFSMSASRDYNDAGRPPHKAWSAGNTAWMPTEAARLWLEQAMKDEGARWGGLWDQDALQNCQPDDIVEIRHARVMNAVHPAFGLPASWQPGDLLIHFTGITPEDRASEARKFIEQHLSEPVREAVDSPFNQYPTLHP